MAPATSSLPVPVSPVMITLESVRATRSTISNTFLIPGLSPMKLYGRYTFW